MSHIVAGVFLRGEPGPCIATAKQTHPVLVHVLERLDGEKVLVESQEAFYHGVRSSRDAHAALCQQRGRKMYMLLNFHSLDIRATINTRATKLACYSNNTTMYIYGCRRVEMTA